MLPSYAELHCLSNFTFLTGASRPEELVERAYELGYAALALTDECSVAGAVRAHEAARDCGLKLIVGAQFKLDDGLKLVLLAADREGYGNLCELITLGRKRARKGAYRLGREDFASGLPGCLALWVPATLSPKAKGVCKQALAERDFFKVLFPHRAWIAVELLRGPDDQTYLENLTRLSRQTGLPLTASGDVHMHARSRQPLQDTLTAIRLKCTVKEAGYALFPNSERHLRPISALAELYPEELLRETHAIAERCTFSLDSLHYEYPDELVPPGETAASYLRKCVEEGLTQRLRRHSQGLNDVQKVRGLIERELALIAELKYEHFFLTVHYIVKWARDQGILCQGRGSAANSAVCYALGITEVDPARTEVLFERFISRERNEPPDIDVDFEHQRREEVMQHIYRKYGRDRAALAATVITYRPKSAIRDVGKALGLDLAQVDRLAKSLAWWDGRDTLPERLKEAGFVPQGPVIDRLLALVNVLVGFPRHLSQHVGGFVISRGPISRLVPIENAAMPERTVIQWDKDDLDTLGLLKVDCLSLGMLSAIRRALALISERQGRHFTMDDVPPKDRATFEMIGRADTIGVFQIESRAQMAMLPRLKPETFYDLVVEVAIVRPGPIQGGMVHPYLQRREKKEEIAYPSEEVRQVLERTLGVPIFQEQVMRLAIVAAGFTPGEADRLRRSMAAWRRSGDLHQFKSRLISGMIERGYTLQYAQQIFRQIQGFGEYGFPESHSTSFALLAYVSAWLKCHEHPAFTCALLNSQPMGFYAPAQLVADARAHGVEIRPVDVTASGWDCTLERRGGARVQPAIRLGLRMIKGLSEAAAKRIVQAREQAAFISAPDLAARASLDHGELARLAASGALSSLAGHRREARWACAGIEAPFLGETPHIDEPRPQFSPPSEGEELVADYASLGFTLGRHPLALLRQRFDRFSMQTAAQLREIPNGQRACVAGLVTCRQRPDTASGVVFVTLEDETGMANVVVWRALIERQRRELLASSLLGVEGFVQREKEVVHLVARRLIDYSRWLGQLATSSRDFH